MIEKKINNYSLLIFNDKDELSRNLSKYIFTYIDELLLIKERVQLCLCGGSTPKSVYDQLSNQVLNWKNVDIFLGDERCVDPLSQESNSLMIKKTLLKHHGSNAFFYEIFNNGKIDEIQAKNAFLSQLKIKCCGNPPVFDLTLLGLGDDGHTASLFPFQENNKVDEYVIFSNGKGLRRISLTPKVLCASKKVIFIVSGDSKSLALKRLLDTNENSDRTPAKLVDSNSEILIFCDTKSSKEVLI